MGDHVIVDSPSKGFTVVKVVGVDPAPRIDLDVNWTYKWIVQKVDARWYTEQLEREQFVADTLVEVERRRQRDLLLTEFQNMLPEGTSARELFDATVLKLKTDRE